MARKKAPPSSEEVASALEFLKEVDIGSILDETIQPRQPLDGAKPGHKVITSDPDTRILQLEEYPADILCHLVVLLRCAQRRNKTPEEVKAQLLEMTEQRKKRNHKHFQVREVIPKDINKVIGGWTGGPSKRAAEENAEDSGPRPKRHQRPTKFVRMMNRLGVDDKGQLSAWSRKRTIDEMEMDEHDHGTVGLKDDTHGDHQALPDVQVTIDDTAQPMEVD
ncbi:hypothetical protein HDK77DRAFT_479277 [Phyllosticta capitalensis]|uniref:uncharacterized protein n=1 Tax=Phyllosticta capitalensis TaxID=121624 RepID=UPI00313269CF